MIVTFEKLSPGGNDTIIVRSFVHQTERASLSRTIMNSEYVGGEQVGYLTLDPAPDIDARLDMMGGELCINALRCAATILSEERCKNIIHIASSGTDQIFECNCERRVEAMYSTIRLTLELRMQRLCQRSTLIQLPGISHLLYELSSEERMTDLIALFTELRTKNESILSSQPAFGIIPFRRCANDFLIYPVVSVTATNSVVPETGCGSGSIALALALCGNRREKTYSVRQPCGTTYSVSLEKTKKGFEVSLGSPMRRLVSGLAYC
jgi:diaminopimelate epimerase